MQSAPWPSRQYALKIAGGAALMAATWVFYIDLCNLYFQCGCSSLWAGATAMCNIHQHGVKHCPICLLPTSVYGAFIATIWIAQSLFIRRGKWLWAISAFPVIAGIQALALGWYRGYWS